MVSLVKSFLWLCLLGLRKHSFTALFCSFQKLVTKLKLRVKMLLFRRKRGQGRDDNQDTLLLLSLAAAREMR